MRTLRRLFQVAASYCIESATPLGSRTRTGRTPHTLPAVKLPYVKIAVSDARPSVFCGRQRSAPAPLVPYTTEVIPPSASFMDWRREHHALPGAAVGSTGTAS